MYVYFIRAGDHGPIKIGKAARPDKRVAQLQPASPIALKLAAVCCGDIAAERWLHRYFEDARLHAEWFEPVPALVDLVDRLPTYEEVKAGGNCPEIVDPKTLACQKLYALGYSYDDIAEAIGLTKQRAHQLVTGYSLAWNKAKPFVPKDRPPRPEEDVHVAFARVSGMSPALVLDLAE